MTGHASLLLPALAAVLLCCPLAQCGQQNYTSMFSFGDSLTDTGNLLVSSPLSNHIVGRYPYGITYFHRSTGRCSDGRLVVDFLAQAFGLPLLQPYLQSRGKDLRRGVNFAVGGATAMDPPFFQEIGASDKLWTNLSLSVQLGWFEQLKPSLCSSPKECKEYFSKSLFLVGEIGGNDYNYAFFKGKTLDDAKTYVPTVAAAVTDATERLIKAGATHLVVPGNLPMGCSSAYLTLHPGRNGSDYDAAGCLRTYNDFAQHHNAVLQRKLRALRAKYPQARIMYADYYGAAMSFAKNPKQFGFTQGPLRTCCGGGGPYNFNPKASCGVRGSSVCADPSAYANWDGVHLTEAAYHAIADSILNGPYTSPRLL
ncbi:GDSL esterase/lipase At5g45910 precursor [Zea mays]|uniref:GDSL esterase/lipase n=1 Tax=Zea mays TaxID=4577 RepID=K7VR43_MAIZE|nr:GDSL esterase/lipase At5g45910 precursor [Zea mays]AQK91022.1 GDSL esterase/lipase [Zea mays]|eukprot:NP_001149156.2 esterase precursor [Zea mays]